MKEEDIRPKEMKARFASLSKEDASKLLQNKNDFLNVLCPACKSNAHKKAFIKEGYRFVVCEGCFTLFVNPRPTPLQLKKYYKESASWRYWGEVLFPKTEEKRRQAIFLPRAHRLMEIFKKYKFKPNRLVDVGAGYGIFCEEAKKLSLAKEIIAVEPCTSLAKACEEKGLCVINNTIEETNLNNIDVITCFELVEHLFCPERFLELCYNGLTKNGLLIITTINIDGFDLRILGHLSENIAAPTHLNYFTIESLTLLLRKVGFDVIEVQTPGKLDVDLVRKKILGGQISKKEFPFMNYLLIDKWDDVSSSLQEFLVENKLSSHLWLVAKKASE
ncbi:class I SAM-dependent methyltransferase [Candidatus Omnitrophota bacterium]